KDRCRSRIADRTVDGRPASRPPAPAFAMLHRGQPRSNAIPARLYTLRPADPGPIFAEDAASSGDLVTQSFLPPLAPYPTTRLRRNRRDAWSRRLVAASTLT